jgi:hypothetical protein
METGIDVSSFPYMDCLLPYGNSRQMDPRFHMGSPIWKRGLIHSHTERVNHRFHTYGYQKGLWKRVLTRPRFHTRTILYHTGIQNKSIPISIWTFPYTRIDTSPFPHGDYPVSNPFPIYGVLIKHGDSWKKLSEFLKVTIDFQKSS